MLRLAIVLCALFYLVVSSYGQSCAKYNFTSNQVFTSCSDLPYLNSSLHWTYDPSSQSAQIAYRHTGTTASRWVAWAINPSSQGMVGSQALVAFQKSDGSLRVYTSPITSYQSQLQEGNLSFPVSDLTATSSSNEIIIFATLNLQNMNSTFNQVWQEGPLSSDSPAMHTTSGPNIQSAGTLNLQSGVSRVATGAMSKMNKANIHGLLNVVSWGIMMPLGILIARYMKVFEVADPAWFYLHATCQTSAYIIGVAGWATGLQLGSKSPGVQFPPHRNIGIVLFCFGTLQVFALLLRPKKDHKYRLYWNIYHHSVGYSIVVLSIINVFKGFNILNPEKKWQRAYIGILVALGLAAATLEVLTWCIVLKRKKESSSSQGKMPRGTNGTNGYNGANGYNVYGGYNGYGTREHSRV